MAGNETSLATYQNFDGSNTTMLLRSFSYKPAQKVTLTSAFGGSTNFNGTNSFVLEGKAKYAPDEHFSLNVRSRNSFNTQNTNFQLRLSADCSTKVADKVSIYADPYVAAKYNCATGKITTDEGIFVGTKYKISDGFSVTGEVQKYNGLEGGSENWGVNVILSHTF